MATGPRRRRLFAGGAVALTLLAAMGPGAPPAAASGAPIVDASWSFAVLSDSARLGAQIDPNGLASSYHFDYMTAAAYDANLGAGKDGFSGAARVPPLSDESISAGGPATVQQLLFGLSPDTAYRYRVVATNSDPASPTTGPTRAFTTQSLGGGPLLPDSRGWEMVSPVDKNGGQVDVPGAIAAGGVLQAAAAGGSVSYGSAASFGEGAQGAPPASQYMSIRGSSGWSTQNITAPIFSGTYGTADEGVPYQLFSPDLARALLLNGEPCRGEAEGCPVANPPLPGSEAPAGYQDYYLRDDGSGAFTALLTKAGISELALPPEQFHLRLAGATPDLLHVVLSSCAKLTPEATEVAGPEGCEAAATNLYGWSEGTLHLINLLPGQTQGAPGARLAAQSGAISEDGARVYFTHEDSVTHEVDLYLREGAATKRVDESVGAGGSFQTASADGSVAFFTAAEHLYRYQAPSGAATDLTPAGEVKGVLGASQDGSTVYYQDAAGLKRWQDGATTLIAPGAAAADPSDYPPTSGTARVSADGARLLFLSRETESLSGYDNTDLITGNPDSEVYLYDVGAATPLTCVSCNPTNERPLGPSSIPGAIANGTAPGSVDSYKPRALAAGGRRVFFDSRDALALSDTNNAPDAYEWEAQGEGSCAEAPGCLSLISSGRSTQGATFVDSSADGSDAFFLTDGSLVGADPGSVDLYDARVGGGFPEPPAPIPCEGDSCQFLPSSPEDPTLTTLLGGPGNPSVRYQKAGKHCKRGFAKRKGKCVKKRHHKRGRGR